MVRKNKYKLKFGQSTEEHMKKAYGSMQIVWSYRRAYEKSIWVNAGRSEVTEGDTEKTS